MSNTWKPKTSGYGEHDFHFNVPPPVGKDHEGHGERASLKNNTCGLYSSSISDEKEETFTREQRLKKYPEIIMIPTRFVGVNFCIKEVL